MSKSSQAVKDWRNRTKNRIIEAMGGKCALCGYNKCQAALELHHLDPSKKSFTFGAIRANPKSWLDIVTELKKCVMLCSNCHKEVEYNGLIIEDKQYFNTNYSDPAFFNRLNVTSNQFSQYKIKQYDKICIGCLQKYTTSSYRQKYCSELCKYKNNPG